MDTITTTARERTFDLDQGDTARLLTLDQLRPSAGAAW